MTSYEIKFKTYMLLFHINVCTHTYAYRETIRIYVLIYLRWFEPPTQKSHDSTPDQSL